MRNKVRWKRRAVPLFLRIIALLYFVTVIARHREVRRVPLRVYFPFEQFSLPSKDALPRFTRAQKHAVRVSLQHNWVREARAARRELELARQNLLAYVVVTQYMQWHRQERANPNARKLIWTGHGNKYGLGDRFRGIIHAYLCAVLSGRVMVIKWEKPFPLQVIFESTKHAHAFFDERLDSENMVDAPACHCSLKNMGILLRNDRVVVHRSEAAPNVRDLLAAVRRYPELPISQELMTLANNWRKRRQLKSDTRWREYGPRWVADDSLFPLIFKALLRPAPSFIHMLSTQRTELRTFIPAKLRKAHGCGAGRRIKLEEGGRAVLEVEEYGGITYDLSKDRVLHMRRFHPGHISVHARLGLGLNETMRYRKRFGKLANVSIATIAACLAAYASRLADVIHHGKPQRFYVATDTNDFTMHFRREVTQRSPGAIVMSAVQGRVDRVHLNRLNSRSPRDREQFLLAAADLFFLSAGDAMVSLHSGFANLARWLGGTPHTLVTASRCAREHWIWM